MLRTLSKIVITGLLSVCVNVAWAEVVVVVSDQSPVLELSATELTDIYLGRLTHLSDGRLIQPIDQAEQSPIHVGFYQQYLGRTPAQIRSHWSRLIFTGRGQPPKSVSGDAAMADALKSNSNAIGYMDSGAVPEGLRILNIES